MQSYDRPTFGRFFARDVALMLRCQCPSTCPSVTFVHCGHMVQWIPDIFACLDRWMSLLLTNSLIVGWDDAGISGERGEGYRKIGNCSDIT